MVELGERVGPHNCAQGFDIGLPTLRIGLEAARQGGGIEPAPRLPHRTAPGAENGIGGVGVEVAGISPYRGKQPPEAAHPETVSFRDAARHHAGRAAIYPLAEQGVPVADEARGPPASFFGRLGDREGGRDDVRPAQQCLELERLHPVGREGFPEPPDIPDRQHPIAVPGRPKPFDSGPIAHDGFVGLEYQRQRDADEHRLAPFDVAQLRKIARHLANQQSRHDTLLPNAVEVVADICEQRFERFHGGARHGRLAGNPPLGMGGGPVKTRHPVAFGPLLAIAGLRSDGHHSQENRQAGGQRDKADLPAIQVLQHGFSLQRPRRAASPVKSPTISKDELFP